MALNVSVRPVRSRRDRKRFLDFPYRFYQDYPYWVAPLRLDVAKTLNPKKNAFFEHGRMELFLAENEHGEVVGRVAGIVNGMHLQKYDDGNGFFGFFESIDDEKVARALLDAATGWLKAQGLTGVRGPANPSMNDIAGLLVDGFDREPAILMPYNPPYYEALLTGYGFERAMTMWAYYIHRKYVTTGKLHRGVKLVQRRNPNITLRTLDMNRYDEEVDAILRIYNDAWHNNWGHVPMTPGEVRQLAKDLKQIVDPNIVYILEDDGEPIAFSITLPDINQVLRYVRNGRLFPLGLAKILALTNLGRITECRTPLMGVMVRYQGKGLDAILNLAIIDRGRANGYEASEMSWVLDSNKVMMNALEAIGGTKDKEYAMLEMPLS